MQTRQKQNKTKFININARIEVNSLRRSASHVMSVLHVNLPQVLKQATRSGRWTTVLAELKDGDGKSTGDVVVSLAPR